MPDAATLRPSSQDRLLCFRKQIVSRICGPAAAGPGTAVHLGLGSPEWAIQSPAPPPLGRWSRRRVGGPRARAGATAAVQLTAPPPSGTSCETDNSPANGPMFICFADSRRWKNETISFLHWLLCALGAPFDSPSGVALQVLSVRDDADFPRKRKRCIFSSARGKKVKYLACN